MHWVYATGALAELLAVNLGVSLIKAHTRKKASGVYRMMAEKGRSTCDEGEYIKSNVVMRMMLINIWMRIFFALLVSFLIGKELLC